MMPNGQNPPENLPANEIPAPAGVLAKIVLTSTRKKRILARLHSPVALKALRMPAVRSDDDLLKARHISCRSFDGAQLAGQVAGRDRCQLYCQEAIARELISE